jgi:glutamine amidotransferase
MDTIIIDSGGANLASLQFALERLDARTIVSNNPQDIAKAPRVILPGVGSALDAMTRLRATGLHEVLPTLKQPVLGICLGMQLLFEASEEDGTECLGLIPGRVRRLDPAPGRPVPHMGWSRLDTRAGTPGLATGDYVYFAHSFACDDGPHSIAVADYGRPIPAVVRKGNVIGAQFHPERSSTAGARFLKAFLAS